MDSTVGTTTPAASEAPPKRRVRNYLLDTSLQLRLAAYLVAVAAALCAALGVLVWDAYRETSRVVALASPEAGDAIANLLAEEDRVRMFVLAAALGLVLLMLLVSAVIVTHRIAGPAYALRRACEAIAEGQLTPPRPLRSGDLLQELGDEFAAMTDALRTRELQERDALASAAAALRAAASGEDERVAIAAMLERLAAEKGKRLGA